MNIVPRFGGWNMHVRREATMKNAVHHLSFLNHIRMMDNLRVKNISLLWSGATGQIQRYCMTHPQYGNRADGTDVAGYVKHI